MSQPLFGSQLRIFKETEKAEESSSRQFRSNQTPGVNLFYLRNTLDHHSHLFSETQNRTSPSLTLKEWCNNQRKTITKIGETDPAKASLISQKLLVYQGTAREREELGALGLPVPNILSQGEDLPGGMIVRETNISFPPTEAGGMIKIRFKGSEQAVSKQMKLSSVEAKQKVVVRGGTLDYMGDYRGEMTTLKLKPSLKSFGRTRYCLVANGQGKFTSSELDYEGGFSNNRFHDLEGKATYFFSRWLAPYRYTGGFQEGLRSGHGVLERYYRDFDMFWVQYRGTWKNDQPETGELFSFEGEIIGRFKEGIKQDLESSKGAVFLSSKTSNTKPSGHASLQISNQEEKEADEEPFVKGKSRPSSAGVSSVVSSEGSFSGAAFDLYCPSAPPLASEFLLPRRLSFAFDPNTSPEIACPLITERLSDPQRELSLDESIELLATCVHYGDEHAKKMEGREAIIVIGSGKAGKSTMINYLSGCTMELKSPKEHGIEGVDKDIVVVKLKEDGGSLDVVMPISHTEKSKGFMPQIESVPDHPFTYCNCPDLLDNRGVEINIASAVNVRNAINRANKVKVVILFNYNSLMADREGSLFDMLNICSNLFGRVEHLKHYAPSILLGITQAPLDRELNFFREWISRGSHPIMHTLSERLFLFDPLERPIKGGWSRRECLSHLANLPPIENPSEVFKTVLNNRDEKKLLSISEQIGENIQVSLREKNYSVAASELRRLQHLRVTKHSIIERLLNNNIGRVSRHFQKIIYDFKEHCHFEHFSLAEILLDELTEALKSFEWALKNTGSLEKSLAVYYRESQDRYERHVEKERIMEEELEKAQGKIEELWRFLEELKQNTLEQMRSRKEKYAELCDKMKEQMYTIRSSYEEVEIELRREMDEQLKKNTEQFGFADRLRLHKAKVEINQERKSLVAEYREKFKELNREKEALLQELEAHREKSDREMAYQEEKFQKKIQVIEAQRIERTQELQFKLLPQTAFGKAAWEKHFGKVGDEPPLPPNILKILKLPCPFWKGKKIEDTHMLTLIPETVDGVPLTLNTLGELIKRPKGGGNVTEYAYYDDQVKEEFGSQKTPSSHWVLMTADIKDFPAWKNLEGIDALQESMIKRYQNQNKTGLIYDVGPSLLDAAVSILMHYVKTGERLFRSDTLAECKETVDGMMINKIKTAVGHFTWKGFSIVDVMYDFDDGTSRRRIWFVK
ncbi:MAG: hypothetical protein WB791_02285 [Waddliaceae bacterium]